VSGEEGNFEVTLVQHPRYVDVDKCIACGTCAEKCPRKVDNEYDAGLSKRKAIYVKYPQAVPLKYAIDADHCIYFQKKKCKACEKFCPTGAILFDDKPKELNIKVGSIIMAAGVDVFNPVIRDIYGYRNSPNVVTSLEFERILSATGPYGGHLVRPSDKKEPQKIAWIQCVGSRDVHEGAKSYCSAVCCTYAIKEAIVAKEHSKNGLDAAIYYIDLRTHGKDFERYYYRARDEAGVRFIKSRISNITPVRDTGNLIIRHVDESGRRVEEEFDMVVLSVGLCVSDKTLALAEKLGVQLDPHHFVATNSFEPVKTSRPGIFTCGALESPKDIPQSVIESSACAAVVESTLAEVRGTMTRTKEIPQEIDVSGQPPRIGVFVCHCGTNIAGIVNIDEVVEYAKSLPGVVFVESNLFSCSQDTQEKMTKVIEEQNLNRVVVAACTPRTHEPLFQETLVNAGINKYLFEMVNIRNQCSWVHSDDPEAATEKAKDLLRMAVAKVGLLEPLAQPVIEITQSALVIGGGIAGMAAAKNLAEQGYHVYLIEKSDTLGGQARKLHETWQGESVRQNLTNLIGEIQESGNIEVFLKTELTHVEGFVGNFKSTIRCNDEEKVLEHGVAIIATGASELKPDGYLYGEDPRVLTGLELDERLIKNDASLRDVKSAVFVQCVGSRIPERPYCSKVCCTHSIKNALELKKINPEIEVFIVYRDIRTYGLREELYREAREKGIIFVRYDFDKGIAVRRAGDELQIAFTGYILKREITIQADMVILASAIVAPKENKIAQMFKLPVNDDGFFVEAHVKLRPIDFATDGVFVCGLAHSPKPVDEAIAQGLGAASRAVTFLSKGKILGDAIVSKINPKTCVGCQGCLEVCPFGAITYIEDRHICQVNEALCKGCGACAATCPSSSVELFGFRPKQLLAQVDKAFAI